LPVAVLVVEAAHLASAALAAVAVLVGTELLPVLQVTILPQRINLMQNF
jgi:hypothetical protein